MTAHAGVIGWIIDTWSPWQKGRAERAGAAVKMIFEKVIEDESVLTDEEVDMALGWLGRARGA